MLRAVPGQRSAREARGRACSASVLSSDTSRFRYPSILEATGRERELVLAVAFGNQGPEGDVQVLLLLSTSGNL